MTGDHGRHSVCLRSRVVLGGCVAEYSGYEERLDRVVQRRDLPSSQVMLGISLADPLGVHRAGGVESLNSLVRGLHDSVAMTNVSGVQHGVLLRMGPLEAYSILGVPMRLVGNRLVSLDAVLGRGAAVLAERLSETTDWRLRLGILDAVLTRLRSNGPRPDPAIVLAWQRLNRAGGRIRIAALADGLGMTRRHLVRRFHEQVGLGPKSVARILRFERAVKLLRDGSRPFHQIAAATGYSDQAHLSREVHSFARCSPGQLARSLRNPPAPQPGPGDVPQMPVFAGS